MEKEKDTIKDDKDKPKKKKKEPKKKTRYQPKLPLVHVAHRTKEQIANGAQNEAETERRVFEIVDMIVKGKSETSCLKHLQERYNIGVNTAYNYYLSAVKFLMPKDVDEYKEKMLAKNIKRLETIIEKTMDKENYRDAIQALKEINRIVCPNNNTVSVATTDTVFQIKFGNE